MERDELDLPFPSAIKLWIRDFSVKEKTCTPIGVVSFRGTLYPYTPIPRRDTYPEGVPKDFSRIFS